MPPPKAGSTPSVVQKDRYRFTINILSASSESFSLRVDYSGYGLTIRTRIPNLRVTLDDQQYLTDAGGTINSRVSYAVHSVSVPQIEPRGENTRLIFDSWNDGLASSDRQVNVQSDTSTDVNYKTQHRLTINTQYGSSVSGWWYDEGSKVLFSVTSPIPDPSRVGVRFSATGYSGDVTGSGTSFTTIMDRPKTITFNWVKQYLLSYSSNPAAVSYVPGSTWRNEGESVTLSQSDFPSYRFLGWTVDGSPKLGSSITLRMSGPCSLVANYAQPSTFGENVEVASTSSVSKYSYDVKNRVVSFVVSGDYGTAGFATVRVPKQLLWPESPAVKIDGQYPVLSSLGDGGSVWIMSFSYTHSDHVVSIPEFQPGLALFLALVAVSILTRRAKRKHS